MTMEELKAPGEQQLRRRTYYLSTEEHPGPPTDGAGLTFPAGNKDFSLISTQQEQVEVQSAVVFLSSKVVKHLRSVKSMVDSIRYPRLELPYLLVTLSREISNWILFFKSYPSAGLFFLFFDRLMCGQVWTKRWFVSSDYLFNFKYVLITLEVPTSYNWCSVYKLVLNSHSKVLSFNVVNNVGPSMVYRTKFIDHGPSDRTFSFPWNNFGNNLEKVSTFFPAVICKVG